MDASPSPHVKSSVDYKDQCRSLLDSNYWEGLFLYNAVPPPIPLKLTPLELSLKSTYTRPPYIKCGKKWLDEENGPLPFGVPVLLKEHLLNGQTQTMANFGDPTVHFHEAAILSACSVGTSWTLLE
ncbi:hypothetical protein TNIN_92611 [Trichonephila inaurata madagascariensis]|uniref:Uncharacterized protein n=1 Tax=Trichonephila inaurata madagascariensis TaxID=2747483 RepID=A0A8X6XW88_9ARAC|nr:hypothetical protein TNIN_92611 [Trichonephila inaurata madagascariensis]